MPTLSSSPPDELQTLRAELAAMKRELCVLTVERDLLLEKLKAYQRQLFAAKSEVRSAGQRELFLNEAEAAATGCEPAQEAETQSRIEVGAHERKPRGRKPLNPALPREIVRHELPEAERFCVHDGHALVEIGAEISEQLDIVPQQVRVIQHQRVKYACPCCDQSIKVTPAPTRLIPKGLLTESALAWVVVSKFADALPLYRIAALLRRFGGDLSRGTLAASVVRAGTAVQPLINLMRDDLLEADLVYGDETTVQVLKEPGRAAQRKSFMWVQMSGSGPPVRLFSYSPTRNTAQAAALYAGIQPGTALMTDGYEPYNQLADSYQLVHLGCWAHARRYLIEAEEALPKAQRGRDHLASQLIRLIGQLFMIESRCKEMTSADRWRVRQHESRVILGRIETLLMEQQHAVLPQSALGKAMRYLQGQWPKLIRYVENGAWPISNNACENAIRPFTVGRKNWLFYDTVAGANAAANLYSLIETCKANDVEPYAYLLALFQALPLANTADDYEALLPWRFITS